VSMFGEAVRRCIHHVNERSAALDLQDFLKPFSSSHSLTDGSGSLHTFTLSELGSQHPDSGGRSHARDTFHIQPLEATLLGDLLLQRDHTLLIASRISLLAL